MDAAVAAGGDLTRFNYNHCYDWTVANMHRPSQDKKHLGQLGAIGVFLASIQQTWSSETSRLSCYSNAPKL
jgi:hypothetical protein